jgi:hypothetical protein
MHLPAIAAVLFLVLLGGCATPASPLASPQVVHAALADAEAMHALRTAFARSNPGYDLCYHTAVRELQPAASDRVIFVQGPAERTAEPAVGDVLLLRAGERWQLGAAGALDLLAFQLPSPLPVDLPKIVRPDWDPLITDAPGGCATEGDAYRRILLTWRPEVGPYILHELNAHRVRIKDSFSHYHPLQGGFDEFYLVQQAPPGARLLTSNKVPLIEARAVDRDQASSLLQSRELHVGDLVYLPRGTMHRGLGGALVQVISVPGFVPKSEIGVDHHLWAINKQLGLKGEAALPFHVTAARIKLVK